jgi:hypothetical protein
MIESNAYQVMNITNYSDETTNKLLISVPMNLDVTKISTSSPLSIQSQPSSNTSGNDTKILSISGITPKSTSSIYIPVVNRNEIALIKPLNPSEFSFTMEFQDVIENPINPILLNSLRNALIYLFVYTLVIIYTERRRKELFDELTEDSKKLREKMDKTEDELKKVDDAAKAKVLEIEKKAEQFKIDFHKSLILLNARGSILICV